VKYEKLMYGTGQQLDSELVSYTPCRDGEVGLRRRSVQFL
jgi:hypothetical protein